MLRLFLLALAACTAFAKTPVYELAGRITPRSGAWVSLYATETPYSASTFLFPGSAFHFKKLPAGLYTLVIFIRGRGDTRRTVEVGPGSADNHRRVSLKLDLKDSDFSINSVMRTKVVSTHELTIPQAAWRDYREAQKSLAQHDGKGATKRLEDAVERAPQFSAAWNNLGTIAYQSKNYVRAEECFREALEQDPMSYEALVNLGGVLVTLHKLDEALTRNTVAVATRPNDALAQSQLGITYFLLGRMELAKTHLERARDIDPAHFTYPQLMLAEIDFRQGDPHAAADTLDDFLTHHPDWPQAAGVRQKILELRSH